MLKLNKRLRPVTHRIMLRENHHDMKISSTEASSSKSPFFLHRNINSLVNFYEGWLGLSEIHAARKDVTMCEERLSKAQIARREKQTEITKIQNRLKEIHAELDRTSRGEDRYLNLLTEEHASIKNEQSLMASFEELETREREALQNLSNKVRVNHEREREREERTKYWSLIGSLSGAILGIMGTMIAYGLRARHIRDLIPTSQEIRPILDEMVQLLKNEQEQILQVNAFMSDLKEAFKVDLPNSGSIIFNQKEDLNELLKGLKLQNERLTDQMNEFKKLIHSGRIFTEDGKAIVYVGDGMEQMLHQTEENLESKIKLQTLISVVAIYSVLGLALPILYFYFARN